MKNTLSVLKSLQDKDNMEVCTQGQIFSNLNERFNSIEGVDCIYSVHHIGNGIEDGTLTVKISPSITKSITPQIIRIGGEVKRTKTCKKTFKELLYTALTQEVCYLGYLNETYNINYDVILIITDEFIGICYIKDNLEAFNLLSDAVEGCTPSDSWKASLYKICEMFTWKAIIKYDSSFNFSDIVFNIINDITIWK